MTTPVSLNGTVYSDRERFTQTMSPNAMSSSSKMSSDKLMELKARRNLRNQIRKMKKSAELGADPLKGVKSGGKTLKKSV